VVRRIEAGELKGRKKTASIYSDWIITMPDQSTQKEVTEQVNEQLNNPPPEPEPEPTPAPEPEPTPVSKPETELEQAESDEMHTSGLDEKAEADALRDMEQSKKEETNARTRKGRSGKWWF